MCYVYHECFYYPCCRRLLCIWQCSRSGEHWGWWPPSWSPPWSTACRAAASSQQPAHPCYHPAGHNGKVQRCQSFPGKVLSPSVVGHTQKHKKEACFAKKRLMIKYWVFFILYKAQMVALAYMLSCPSSTISICSGLFIHRPIKTMSSLHFGIFKIEHRPHNCNSL